MGKLRVLVVDDEKGTREGLKALLEREGHEVRTAGDAAGALRWIKQVPLDCLLIDLDLSRDPELGINGLDVIVLLRIHQPTAKAILMSASADPALTRLAQERGAVGRLEKPFDLAVLTRLLHSLFPNEEGRTPYPSILCPSS